MFEKLYKLLIFCFLIVTVNAQKTLNAQQFRNDLANAFEGKYEKDLCTPTNDCGLAICELYTITIQKKNSILNIDGQNIEKKIKLFSKKINKNLYQIYDNRGINIGMIYNVNGTFYFRYNNFMKAAEEKMKNKGYKFNKIE